MHKYLYFNEYVFNIGYVNTLELQQATCNLKANLARNTNQHPNLSEGFSSLRQQHLHGYSPTKYHHTQPLQNVSK